MPLQLDDAQATSLKLFVVLSKAYKAISEQVIKDVKQYGLSPSEFMILEVLYTKRRIPLQQIGEKILVTSGSVTYNIDKLEKKQLLRRVPCREDRRVIYAEITEAGDEFLSQIFPDHAVTVHHLMEGISLTEQEAAIALLKKLGKSVKPG
ncbi:MarR family winged helix-turn-helix transcriptional regulator [Paenibacillus terreus]|uniref:MarR family winged helix-turn-helix transcriptional regulator n=1 Tax=Paenibacillus terreus TaxID=1387834 RepID=A0ABV5BFM2_9BACL